LIKTIPELRYNDENNISKRRGVFKGGVSIMTGEGGMERGWICSNL